VVDRVPRQSIRTEAYEIKKKKVISFRSNFPLLQYVLYIIHKTVIKGVPKKTAFDLQLFSIDIADS
jgi:hypothetical protein